MFRKKIPDQRTRKQSMFDVGMGALERGDILKNLDRQILILMFRRRDQNAREYHCQLSGNGLKPEWMDCWSIIPSTTSTMDEKAVGRIVVSTASNDLPPRLKPAGCASNRLEHAEGIARFFFRFGTDGKKAFVIKSDR